MNEEQIQAWLKERSDARFFVKAFPVAVKVMDDEKRVLRFAISDERRDRDGDIVRQLGLDTTEYAQNPVVFMGRGPMHANSGFPIARSIKVFRKYAGNMLTTYSDDMFAGDAQRHDEAELAYALARDGFLNTASIGFRPTLVRDLPDDALTDDEKDARANGKWVRGYDIRRSIKYEHSLVGIPSNIGATVQRSLDALGIKSCDRAVADFVEVARRFLKGAKLDAFRQALIGERELITIGAFSVDKAPATYRESLAKDVSGLADADPRDEGFDAWEQWIGVKCPDAADEVVTKSAVSVPVADAPIGEGSDSEVVETTTTVKTITVVVDEEVEVADPDLADPDLASVISEQKTIIQSLTERIAALESKRVEPTSFDPEVLASRFEKALSGSADRTAKALSESEARTARLIEDALIELELHKDNEIFAVKNGKTSVDATPDPARVAKDVSPPVEAKVVTVASPATVQLDPQAMAAMVPAVIKALNIEGIVEQVIYRHRGGITLPMGD